MLMMLLMNDDADDADDDNADADGADENFEDEFDDNNERDGLCFSSVSAANCKTSWPLSLLMLLTTFNI